MEQMTLQAEKRQSENGNQQYIEVILCTLRECQLFY